MEGDSSGNYSKVKEQGGGESDYSFGIDGVIHVLCLNWVLQALGGESLSPLSMRAQVLTAFIVCEEMICKLNLDLHSR